MDHEHDASIPHDHPHDDLLNQGRGMDDPQRPPGAAAKDKVEEGLDESISADLDPVDRPAR